MDPVVWDRWLAAYCRIRQYGPLEKVPEGLFLEVGKRQQSGRYFVSRFEETALRRFLAGIHEPATYIELPVSQDLLVGVVPDGWHLGDPGFLMSCDLPAHPSATELARSYTANVNPDRSLCRAFVRASCGELVASGVCFVQGSHAIFDEITTAVPHQRQGLGSFVVSSLANWAAGLGAETGLLLATAEGRKLYKALGWTQVSEVSTLISATPVQKTVQLVPLLVAA